MAVKPGQGQAGGVSLSEGVRSILSLLIFIHLFCVVVSLFGNESASVLRDRLVGLLGSYTRLLNLDPEFTAGLHLTHATEYEDDHQLVLEIDDQVLVYPPTEETWGTSLLGFRQQRWRLLTQRLGLLATTGNDEAIAELARAIGEGAWPDGAAGARPLVFRCRRLRPAELNTDVDRPLDQESTYEVVYAADVLLDSQGAIRVHKQIQADEVAPVREPPDDANR
jgi:hypothetical protein